MHFFTSHRHRIIVICIFWFCIIPISWGWAAQTHRILVLNSYHPGFTWSDNVMKGIQKIFEDSHLNVELTVEYMDTKRYDPEKIFPYLEKLYRLKYQHQQFDGILVSDNNALTFLLDRRHNLFPGVPIVFCGINNYSDDLLENHQNITGVAENFDIKGTLTLALRLHPQTQYIVVLSDTTASGKLLLTRMQDIAPEFKEHVHFIELANLTAEELIHELHHLPKDSMILYLAFYRDRNGKTFSVEESTKLLMENSNVPIYSAWDFMIINGILGGIVTNGYEQGRNAALMMRKILEGESASVIPILRESPNVPMFDYHRLVHFDIARSKLPEGSIITNEPESFYYRYKVLLISSLVFILCQTLVLIALGISIGRRRMAEKSLRQLNTSLQRQTEENARLFNAEARRRREAETLRMTIQALSATLDLQEVFELILSELQRVVPYDSASVQQLTGNYLEIIGGHGFPNLHELLGVRFDLHTRDNPNQQVIQTRSPLILKDAPAIYAEFQHGPHAQAAIRSWLGVPLLFGNRLIGMLTLDKQEPDFYTQEHARLALVFASQAAIAVENAHLFESERTQLYLAQTIQEVGSLLTTQMSLKEVFERIFDLLAQVVSYDSVSIQLLDDHSGNLILVAGRGFPDFEMAKQVSLRISASTLKVAWEECKFMVIPDTHADPRWDQSAGHKYIRSWIGAALFVKGNLVGMLNVDSKTVQAYDETVAQTVAAFANQAAIAIENARMFSDLKQAEEALRKLNEELEQRVEERTVELQATNRALAESLDDLRTTQTQLILSEKMSALGGLVAGVAHEINTPLGVGVTAASYFEQKTLELKQRYDTGQLKRSDLERYIDKAEQSSRIILENLRRASEQIHGFKQVAVDQTNEIKRRFNLKTYIDDVFLSLHPKLRKTSYQVTVQCPEHLEIFSFPGAFSQIITNFVLNTLIHGFEHQEQGDIVLTAFIENDIFILQYTDDGKGVHTETCSKIFEPFFTTKRGQGGSGLGLHIVYNLVTQKLHGHIECKSALNQGIMFTIQIPGEKIL